MAHQYTKYRIRSAMVDGMEFAEYIYKFLVIENIDNPILRGNIYFSVPDHLLLYINAIKKGSIISIVLDILDANRYEEQFEASVISTETFNLLITTNKVPINSLSLQGASQSPNEVTYTNSPFVDFNITFVDALMYYINIIPITANFENITVKSLIENLCSMFNINRVEFDSDINNTMYDQIPIYNETFFDAIKYIDDLYGIYSGKLGIQYKINNGNIELKFNNINNSMDFSNVIMHNLSLNNDQLIEAIYDKKVKERSIKILISLVENIVPKEDFTSFYLRNQFNKRYIYYPDNKPIASTSIDIPNEFLKNNKLLVYRDGSFMTDASHPELLINRFRHYGNQINAKNYFTKNLNNAVYDLTEISIPVDSDFIDFDIKSGMILDWVFYNPELMKIGGKYIIKSIIRIYDLNYETPLLSENRNNMILSRINLLNTEQ